MNVRPKYLTPVVCPKSFLHADHDPHNVLRMLERNLGFSSDDNDFVADAVYLWTMGGESTPPGSCARYFAKCMERDVPFSPRLQLSMHVIERIWYDGPELSELAIIQWLNRLNIDPDDIVEKSTWHSC